MATSQKSAKANTDTVKNLRNAGPKGKPMPKNAAPPAKGKKA